MSVEDTSLTGLVLEIQRMSTEDGPGIRTTVFMKGCPMQCLWCHNPESISSQPQIHWIGMRCLGCKTCLETCTKTALTMKESGIYIDRTLCDGCGACAETCPGNALELLGKRWTVDELLHEVLKDREYYQKSSGGVTISGGESTLQWKFVAALLKGLKEQGIHTAIDTCGIVRKDALDAILPYTDLVLYDLKEGDPKLHQEYTHAPQEPVLDTLSYLASYLHTHPSPSDLWIRTPLIPDCTARKENVETIGKIIAEKSQDTVSRWDLLAFNNLCKDKYFRLGLDWKFNSAELLTRETMEDLADSARKSGVNPAIVQWSGSTRLEEGEQEEIVHPQAKPVSGC